MPRSIKISLIKPSDMSEDLISEWRSIQKQNGILCSPFLDPTFISLVSGLRPEVRVAVIEGQGGVGFLPFEQHNRTGRPVAAWLSNCQAIIKPKTLEINLPDLVKTLNLSSFDFTFVPENQNEFSAYAQVRRPFYAVNLAEGFEAYAGTLKAAGSTLVSQTWQRMRRMERKYGEVRISLHDAEPRQLEQLVDWKRKQYRTRGIYNVFSNDWSVQLLRDVLSVQDEHFAGYCSTLMAGKEIAAIQLGIRSQNTLFQWFHSYGYEFDKFSPGIILLLSVCREAPDNAINRIELGIGQEIYKRRFANDSMMLLEGSVAVSKFSERYRRTRRWIERKAGALPVKSVATLPRKAFNALDRYRFG